MGQLSPHRGDDRVGGGGGDIHGRHRRNVETKQGTTNDRNGRDHVDVGKDEAHREFACTLGARIPGLYKDSDTGRGNTAYGGREVAAFKANPETWGRGSRGGRRRHCHV